MDFVIGTVDDSSVFYMCDVDVVVAICCVATFPIKDSGSNLFKKILSAVAPANLCQYQSNKNDIQPSPALLLIHQSFLHSFIALYLPPRTSVTNSAFIQTESLYIYLSK